MVAVALFVRLEAKPGKKKRWNGSFATDFPWSTKSPRPRLGSVFVSAPRPSASLTRFLTRAEGKRICREKSLPRSWRRPVTCSPTHRVLKVDVLPQSSPASERAH